MKTLLVIPVYNHGGFLKEVVRKGLATGLPLLVVDDGSTDRGTAELKDLDCYIITIAVNRGKGAAIMAGARFAADHEFDAIVTFDADGQHDPADAVKLISRAERQWPVIVVGAREMTEATVPKASLFGRAFSNFWVRLETGMDLPDTQSGYRLYPVRELLRLPLKSLRYDFEVEVLVRAAWARVPVDSIPVSVHYPPQGERCSHFHKLKDNFQLTCLHTKLVTRALMPWPHRPLIDVNDEAEPGALPRGLSLLHPVKLLKRLCREHTSTLELSVAVWMGLFLGALPLLACHTLAILYVTHRLHLNKLAAVTASQLCAPPVVPVLCIQVGYFLRHGSFLLELNWETGVVELHYRLWEWLLGSLLVGPLLGFVFGGLVYWCVNRFRSREVTACG